MTTLFPTAALTADLKFLADRSAPLVYLPSKGGGDQTEHLGNYRSHSVDILDARVHLADTSLDKEGFKLQSHRSAVDDFYDNAQLRSIYEAEIVELLKQVAGARRVEVFDHTRRSSSTAKQAEHGSRDPANIVHNDYTEASGPRRVVDFFGQDPDEAKRLMQRRFAIINVWRPIGEPVVDHPLVLCDARTVRECDLAAVERRGEDRIGELQVALYDPAQRWYYYPRMHRDEVLLFKTYDSSLDGRTRFTPHSSCKVADAREDAPPRESVESRCLVFF